MKSQRGNLGASLDGRGLAARAPERKLQRQRERFESMSSTEEAKKNKPSDSAFKQQRLKAWQPILTPNVRK